MKNKFNDIAVIVNFQRNRGKCKKNGLTKKNLEDFFIQHFTCSKVAEKYYLIDNFTFSLF